MRLAIFTTHNLVLISAYRISDRSLSVFFTIFKIHPEMGRMTGWMDVDC